MCYVCKCQVQIQFIIISKNTYVWKREGKEIFVYMCMWVLLFYLYKMMLMKTEL